MDKETTESGDAEIKDNPVLETDDVVCNLKNEEGNDNNADIADSSSKSNIVTVEFLIKKTVNSNKNDDKDEGEEVEEDNEKNASKYVPIKYDYGGGFFDKHFADSEVQVTEPVINQEDEEEEVEEDNKKNASKYVPIKYSYSGGFFDKHFAEIEVQMNLAEAKNSLVKACNILKELNYLESRKKYSEDDFSLCLLETNAEENSEELVIVTDIIENTPEQNPI